MLSSTSIAGLLLEQTLFVKVIFSRQVAARNEGVISSLLAAAAAQITNVSTKFWPSQKCLA